MFLHDSEKRAILENISGPQPSKVLTHHGLELRRLPECSAEPIQELWTDMFG